MNMRWKRNWPLVAIFLWVVVFMTLFLGSERVVAYTSSTTRSSTTSTTTAVEGKNYENSLELFDARQVHQVQVKMDEDTYQQMISTYQNTGEKEYFQADVVIDGVEIKNVGIRLKGNASLRTALGGGGRTRWCNGTRRQCKTSESGWARWTAGSAGGYAAGWFSRG